MIRCTERTLIKWIVMKVTKHMSRNGLETDLSKQNCLYWKKYDTFEALTLKIRRLYIQNTKIIVKFKMCYVIIYISIYVIKIMIPYREVERAQQWATSVHSVARRFNRDGGSISLCASVYEVKSFMAYLPPTGCSDVTA